MFDIIIDDYPAALIAGILNSSVVAFSKFLFGRPVGNEGNLKTEVIDVTMMPVPDPRAASTDARRRVCQAFDRLKKRPALQFLSAQRLRRMAYSNSGRDGEISALSDLSELDMEDRRELDDAVFRLLGVKDARLRQEWVDRLYDYLREFFEGVRQKEELAIANKNRSKKRASLTPGEIATQILDDVRTNHGSLLRSFREFVDPAEPNIVIELPSNGIAEVYEDIFSPHGSVRFMKGRKQIFSIATRNRSQAALVAFISLNGVRGLTRVPISADECQSVLRRYQTFLSDRNKRLQGFVLERTKDVDLQEEILKKLAELFIGVTNS